MNTEINKQIFKNVEGDYKALMLFGSVARWDAHDESDIDVLQLTSSLQKPYSSGKINFSPYTSELLNKMACKGSLFALHLKLEGEVVEDSSGELISILKNFSKPETYGDLRSDLAVAAHYLSVGEVDYLINYKRLNSLCIFMVRSMVFSLCADENRPTFSLCEAAVKINEPLLLMFNKLKYLETPSFELFVLGRELLNKYLKIDGSNQLICPDALMLAFEGKSDLIVSLGRRLRGDVFQGPY